MADSEVIVLIARLSDSRDSLSTIVKLPRFRGHRTIWVRGVHDGQDKSSVPA